MKTGKIIWYIQRYTAIYFLIFLVYLEYLGWTKQLTYQMINSHLLFKTSITIFITLTCMHGFIGLWSVGTDYLTTRVLGFLSFRLGNFANLIRKIYEVVFIIVGISVLFLYLSIIWF